MRLIQTLLKFFFTIWFTISLVFFLSQLLPTSKAPKGMLEADYAVYGSTNSETLQKVKEDYYKRKGLDLPLFYFDFKLYGKLAAKQIPVSREDEPWITPAVMKHGAPATRAFYTFWKKWSQNAPPKEKNSLIKNLLLWAEQDSHSSAVAPGKGVPNFLAVSSSKGTPQLQRAWSSLQNQSSPIYYHFPALRWNGGNNTYHHWIKNICQGNLGSSTQDHSPVTEKVKEAFKVSSSLAIAGLTIAVMLSFVAGLHFSQNIGSVFTKVCQKFLYFLDSIPGFLIALTIFGVYLALGGSLSSSIPEDTSESFFLHLLNPAVLLGSVCIALLVVPHLTLQFTQGLSEQKNKFYYRTALGKGISSRRAMWRHALPNTLVPTLTLLSEVIISLVAGVLVVEMTFSLPGIGSLFTNSIIKADYPVMVGLTLLLLIFRLTVVWLSDLAFVLIDPRIKFK